MLPDESCWRKVPCGSGGGRQKLPGPEWKHHGVQAGKGLLGLGIVLENSV